MILLPDDDKNEGTTSTAKAAALFQRLSLQQREDLVRQLLDSLPLSSVAKINRHISSVLHIDITGMLPLELSLHIFSFLPYKCLLNCALVSKKWNTIANDPTLWKVLCHRRGWQWKQPAVAHPLRRHYSDSTDEFDDEGVGEEEDSDSGYMPEPDSGYGTQILSRRIGIPSSPRNRFRTSARNVLPSFKPFNRHSAPSALPSVDDPPKPDYKLLYQTHILLRNRLRHGKYHFSALQTQGTPGGHTSTIYCLQLYTYPGVERQVLFTGSKDHAIREWNLATKSVCRVFEGVHDGSVLSLCAYGNYLASAGSDFRVCVWDLRDGKLIKTIEDHDSSVLCVRFDDKKLISCSKDRTIRTYLFPHLEPQHVLLSHTSAVNAISICGDVFASASGDKSIRIWDAKTGQVLQSFEGHHFRGIASIDFQPPYILSGSSDQHLRLYNIMTKCGWSTLPEFNKPEVGFTSICDVCGTYNPNGLDLHSRRRREGWRSSMARFAHRELVRTVALGDELALSGSYDQTIKVWDRHTGEWMSDLVGGHEGRIFCIGFDATKVVSCGEDQKICIWDMSFDLDTSFIQL